MQNLNHLFTSSPNLDQLYKRRKVQMKPGQQKKADKVYDKYFKKAYMNVKAAKDQQAMTLLAPSTIKVTLFDAYDDWRDYIKDKSFLGKVGGALYTSYTSGLNLLPQPITEEDWDRYKARIRVSFCREFGVFQNTSAPYSMMMEEMYEGFREVMPRQWEEFMAGRTISEYEDNLRESHGLNKHTHFLMWAILEYGDQPEVQEFVMDTIERMYPELSSLPSAIENLFTPEFFYRLATDANLHYASLAMYLYMMMIDPIWLMSAHPAHTIIARNCASVDRQAQANADDEIELLMSLFGL